MTIRKSTLLAATGLCLGFSALAAGATTLKVTVTNNQAAGGLTATPVYSAFHNGSFDAFNVGQAASAGLELIAEVGDPSGLPAERLAADPNATAGVVASPSGPPPLQPGETASALIDVNATSRYFSFLSMVIPSNDTFVGNDNAMAYEVFDAMGSFIGPLTIEVTGASFYDAGTEVNDPADGPAFVAGQDGTTGTPENGTVQQATSLAAFAGLELATGAFLGDAAQIDFTSNPREFSFLTISIEEVAPVPLPASAPLVLLAMGGLGLLGRRRKSKA